MPAPTSDRPLALVTGASSGIGVCFARELARRGFDLLLTARRVDRLESLQAEITDAFPVQVTTLASDLGSRAGAEQLHRDVLQAGHDVSLLVNNAGLGKYGPLVGQSLDEIDEMIQVNVIALTMLTRLFAEDFKARGGGYILNHASFSAIQPPPPYSVYAATKSYVLAFSQALNQDIRGDGVKVSALCPSFFTSEFLSKARQRPGWIVRMIMLDPQRVAHAGIRGVLRGKPVIIPGLLFKGLNLLLRLLPRSFATGLADFAVKY